MRGLFAALLLAQAAQAPGLRVQDEGATKGYADTLNCTGTAITCSVAGRKATVNVTAGGGGTPGGVNGNVQINSAGTSFAAYTGTSCAYAVKTLDANGAASCTAAPTIPADISGAHYVTTQAEAGLSAEAVLPTCTGTDKLTFNGTTISCATDQTSAGGGAPTTSTYILQTADAALPNAQAIGSLATGLLKGTTTTGVLSIAVAGDLPGGPYLTSVTPHTLFGATHSDVDTSATSAGDIAVRNAGNTQWSHFPIGAATTVLHGGSTAPVYSAVSLTADVTGIAPLANGGTNASLAASNGAIVYSTATAHAHSGVGTAGRDMLLSGGAGAPTWARGDQILIQSADLNGNGTTPVALTGLSVALTSGSTYAISCRVALTNASTTNGARLTVTSPAVTAATYTVGTMATSATAYTYTNATAASTWPAACTTSCIAQRYMLTLEVVIVPSASSAWSLSGVFSASGTTLLSSKGSWCSVSVL